MKLIEAMKEVKLLDTRNEDLRQKVSKYCADLEAETPTYGTPEKQKEQVTGWLQSIHDSIVEAIKLRSAIARTNMYTMVTIELGGNKVTRPISEWILRRRVYSEVEKKAWDSLSNKGLQVANIRNSSGDSTLTKVRLYFDALERDKNVELYRSEPSIIDRNLEIINATTDLIAEVPEGSQSQPAQA
jgi:hypothetical protein